MNGYYYKVVPKEGRETEKKGCHGCNVAKQPACDIGIPCCRCAEERCNSRQPCRKTN